MQLTDEQRIFIVETFFRLNNKQAVKNEFRVRFPNRVPPTDKTIRRLIAKFHDRGSVKNQNPFNSGRRRTTRIPGNFQRVRDLLPTIQTFPLHEIVWESLKIHSMK